MKKFDVIIIGGGHNGLVAACVLSKKGKKVLVIEKNEKLGGLANYAESLSYISKEVIDELNIKIEKNVSENFVSALSEDLKFKISTLLSISLKTLILLIFQLIFSKLNLFFLKKTILFSEIPIVLVIFDFSVVGL